jgi:uncharacterized protein (DUF983 family)
MKWNEFFKMADEKYGNAIAEEDSDQLVICPECGEPLFEADYEEKPVCHACGFNLETDEYEEEDE